MKHTLHIAWKSLLVPFYQRHAGLFLFLFVALFGVAENPGIYHYRLMRSILLSHLTLSLVGTAWLLYGFKTLSFVTRLLQSGEYSFLKLLQAFSYTRLFLLFTGLQVLLLAPIWVYAFATAAVGIYTGSLVSAFLIISFMLLLISGTAWLCCRALLGIGLPWQWPVLPWRMPKPFIGLLLWYSLNQGKMKLAGVKLISFTLLFIPLVWNAGHNNLSDFVLFFQVAIAAHALVAYDYIQFLEKGFPGLRNLPVSLIRIFLLFPAAYAVLLIPEAIILFHYLPAAGFGTKPASLLLYWIGQLVFVGSIAYERNLSSPEYLMAVGVVSVCSFFIMPLLPFWLIGTVLALAGFLIFNMLYYRYEAVYAGNMAKDTVPDQHSE